jgi:hypothetical protein
MNESRYSRFQGGTYRDLIDCLFDRNNGAGVTAMMRLAVLTTNRLEKPLWRQRQWSAIIPVIGLIVAFLILGSLEAVGLVEMGIIPLIPIALLLLVLTSIPIWRHFCRMHVVSGRVPVDDVSFVRELANLGVPEGVALALRTTFGRIYRVSSNLIYADDTESTLRSLASVSRPFGFEAVLGTVHFLGISDRMEENDVDNIVLQLRKHSRTVAEIGRVLTKEIARRGYIL